MIEWVVVAGALIAFLIAKRAVQGLVGAAWRSGRISTDATAVAFAVIGGVVQLAAGLWLLIATEAKWAGVMVLALWLLLSVPWSIALGRYVERYVIGDQGRRGRRSDPK